MDRHDRTEAFLKLISAIWAGLILGVSFLATVAKFRAPSLTMPVALDVGRQTFSMLAQVEWVLAVLVVVLLWFTRPSWLYLAGQLTQPAFFVAEAAWLLPLLDARVSVVIAGGTNPPSHAHIVFIALEALRAVLLIAGGIVPVERRSSAPELWQAGGSNVQKHQGTT